MDKLKSILGTSPANIGPLEVKVEGSFNEALKKFKSMVQKERIIADYKDRQHYEKPSEKKRRRNREALERKMLAELRQKQIESGEWEKKQQRKRAKRQERQEQNSDIL